MNARTTPIAMFTLLLLALGMALYHQPAEPPPPNAAMPVLNLHPLERPSETQAWQPTPGRMTLVNFFASWCVPCLAEHPNITQLSKQKQLDIVGIAWNDSAENLQRWLKKNGNPFHAVYLDKGGEAAITMGIRGVPESFLIDAQGKVVLHLRGAIMEPQLPQLITTIEAGGHDAPAR